MDRELSANSSEYIHNQNDGVRFGGGGGGVGLNTVQKIPSGRLDNGQQRQQPALIRNGGERMIQDTPGVTNWSSMSEVSADSCSDLVRYEPRIGKLCVAARNTRNVSPIYSNWNGQQDIVMRPPIVFNGTFPIDKPISSRFVNGIPETINEEREESSGTGTEESTSSSGGDGLRVDKKKRGRRGEKARLLLHYNRRLTMDGNRVRFRRRLRTPFLDQ